MRSKPPTPLEVRTLLTGLAFGESPRWHEDRLWFSNWGMREIVAVGLDGKSEVILRMPSFPFSIDWLPDGRLLITSGRDGLLRRREPDGTLMTHADLTRFARGWNEIVVDGRGNAYINGAGFDLLAGEPFAPGIVALVTPDGSARPVADGVAFPNGMAVTPDNSTLIVAESYGKRLTAFDIAADGRLSNRRVWADLGDGVPDGICLDADKAVWYGDVPNKRCVRVREGGEVLQTINLDRGCFACMLGGADGRTLFLSRVAWSGKDDRRGTNRPGPDRRRARPACRVAISCAKTPGPGDLGVIGCVCAVDEKRASGQNHSHSIILSHGNALIWNRKFFSACG